MVMASDDNAGENEFFKPECVAERAELYKPRSRRDRLIEPNLSIDDPIKTI